EQIHFPADLQTVKSLFADADHRERVSIQPDRLSDDVRPASEALDPISMTDHRNRRPVSHTLVLACEDTTQLRPHAEGLKIIAADDILGRSLGRPIYHQIAGVRPLGQDP